MQTDYGLDTSRWQGTISDADVQTALAAGKTFWYFKGGGGDDGLYTDSQFGNTLSVLRRYPIKRGVYWFSSPPTDNQDAANEATYACQNVWNNLAPGEVPILDIDTFGASDPTWTYSFLQTAKAHLGIVPVLYMNQNTENNLDWSAVVRDFNPGLIIADYAVPPAGDVGLRHWPFYLGQQYSSQGAVGRISPVDLDAIFVTDISVWDKYGMPAPAPAPDPAPTQPLSQTTTNPVIPAAPAPPAEPTPVTEPSPTTGVIIPPAQPQGVPEGATVINDPLPPAQSPSTDTTPTSTGTAPKPSSNWLQKLLSNLWSLLKKIIVG